jgi:ribosome-associated heat shock protein Hsp15
MNKEKANFGASRSAPQQSKHEDKDAMRVDKWLWVTRHFKTRSLAAEAIESGRVKVNDERAKPAKLVKPGDTVHVRKPPYEFALVVKALSDRRGPAKEAQLLYEETPQSIAERDKVAAEMREMPPPLFKGRPTKKDRRELERFQSQYNEDQ